MEKNTNLSLNRLFHYTNSIDNLINILKTGFKIKYSLEKLGIFEDSESNLTDEFAIPMICFCDIPLNNVKQHMSIYGNYAIGLKKKWGEKQGICPIIYIARHGETNILIKSIIKNISKNNKNFKNIKNTLTNSEQKTTMSNVIILYDLLIDLIMYVKPYIGYYEKKLIGFSDNNYKFYDEREWRYKPNKFLCKSFLTKKDFLSSNVVELNKNLGVVNFCTNDITDIIVPQKDIVKIKNELKKIKKLKNLDFKIIDTIENKIKNNINCKTA